ncbi:hypothetical protein B0J18DRAFT_429565 [Chaetomium sp. MPI-SDFR-AT-0129]|nr:hypothetical protein B0J18DRAFT_429565 [Chaetomium sp. MPI-SDFR-AT-0129]
MESPRSPKRRRILSSINPPEKNNAADVPEDPRRDRSMTPTVPPQPRGDGREPSINDEDAAKGQSDEADYGPREPKATKFRFKSSSSRSSRRRERDEDDEDDDRYRRHRHHRHRDEDGHDDESRSHRTRDRSRERDKSTERARHRRKHGDADDTRDGDNSSSQRSRRHHRHHHRHRRRRRSHSPRPDPPPEPENDPFQDPPLSPTTAFRESLFDAMADDEGAAYWESVYGQPIHIYAPPHTASGGPGAGGMLEQMTEDEYAAYVRQKMWEKTHAGLMEARARRQREREEEREKAEERARVNREMERSLRRGEERRKRRGWRERWEKYRERWTVWESEGGKGIAATGEDGDAGLLKEQIPWPVISSGGSTGGYGDEGVDGEAVRAFFVNGIGLEELGEKEFAAQLKEERVRWHPDKMQRRLGGKVDEKIMRDVTAIFQVVDALWNDTRKKSG